MKIKYLILTALIVCGLVSGSIATEKYKIGAGDILEIRFWQDVTLNAVVTVNKDGMISLDVAGAVEAAGKTTEILESEIVRSISRYNPKISQAVVRVTTYNYQHVFIKGQIAQPGKKTFEEIPDLWTLINEAGGSTEYGDLSRVTIIRGGDEAGKIEQVDLLDAIENGNLDKLPKLERQDTIEIPRTPIGVAAGDIADQVRPDKNVIYILGAVNSPGPIRFRDNLDLMEALALAGGPNQSADLSKARVVSKDGLYAQTLEIDLDKYSRNGYPARYILQSEDTFILPNKRSRLLSLGSIAQILGVVSTVVIVYDRLKSD